MYILEWNGHVEGGRKCSQQSVIGEDVPYRPDTFVQASKTDEVIEKDEIG